MAVYFISSRLVDSTADNYKNFLLSRINAEVSEKKFEIKRASESTSDYDYIAEVIKATEGSSEKLRQTLNKLLKKADTAKEQKMQFIKDCIKNLGPAGLDLSRESLCSSGTDTILSREVFHRKTKGNGQKGIHVLGVNELSDSDKKNLSENKIIWCDEILDFLKNKYADEKEFVLLLHDMDVDGYSDNKFTQINQLGECVKRNLVTEGRHDRIEDLKIIFFKHEYNPVFSVLNPKEEYKDDKELENAFTRMKENLMGVGTLIEIAEKRPEPAKKEVEQLSKTNG